MIFKTELTGIICDGCGRKPEGSADDPLAAAHNEGWRQLNGQHLCRPYWGEHKRLHPNDTPEALAGDEKALEQRELIAVKLEIQAKMISESREFFQKLLAYLNATACPLAEIGKPEMVLCPWGRNKGDADCVTCWITYIREKVSVKVGVSEVPHRGLDMILASSDDKTKIFLEIWGRNKTVVDWREKEIELIFHLPM